MTKVLLSEGSSFSARETVNALGPLGYHLEVCDPNPLCLARFSRFVKKVHRCPQVGVDPLGYLRFVMETLQGGGFDVLLPVHEQSYLFARVIAELRPRVGIAVAPFAAYEALQGKVALSEFLSKLNLSMPRTAVARTRDALARWDRFPVFVKADCGTASNAVWRWDSAAERDALLTQLEAEGAFAVPGAAWVLQDPAPGVLETVQGLFDHGRLVAVHGFRREIEGVRGGSSVKVSVARPSVERDFARIGQSLEWHGSLSFEYFFEEATGGVQYIDANPRLVEPMNAVCAGVNLADLQVRLSLGEPLPAQPPARVGVRTHTLLGSALAAGARGAGRAAIWREARLAWKGAGPFSGSQESLTPVGTDRRCLTPLLLVGARLLANPGFGARLGLKTVSNYALTPAAVDLIRHL